jgi:hypothetical protein
MRGTPHRITIFNLKKSISVQPQTWALLSRMPIAGEKTCLRDCIEAMVCYARLIHEQLKLK